jgi:tetratricopeptide (TPR) repeat protein
MQAYELYLKARENFIARRELDLTVKMFERVVALDPKFARGWEGLAATCSVAPSWGYKDRDYMALAGQAADRALELGPEAVHALGSALADHRNTWPTDFSVVIGNLDKAVAADPRNATAFLWRGIAWTRLGFFDRALADTGHAVELEPNYLNAIRHKALALAARRQGRGSFRPVRHRHRQGIHQQPHGELHRADDRARAAGSRACC